MTLRRNGIVFLLALSVQAACAQDLDVAYLEGVARIAAGSAWRTLSIGDRVSPEATLVVGEASLLELARPGARILLSQRGTYSVKTVLAASRSLGTAGAGRALRVSLASLAGAPVRNRNAALGLRGGNRSSDDGSGYVTSSAGMFVDAGRQFISSGQYDLAIEQFLQALDAAEQEELPEVRFNLASAYALDGDTRSALKQAASVQPGGAGDWTADFVILKATLLMECSAFSQQVDWLTRPENDLSGDAVRAALYYFLLGAAYTGIGEASKGQGSLARAVEISEGSDIGKAAARLLAGP